MDAGAAVHLRRDSKGHGKLCRVKRAPHGRPKLRWKSLELNYPAGLKENAGALWEDLVGNVIRVIWIGLWLRLAHPLGSKWVGITSADLCTVERLHLLHCDTNGQISATRTTLKDSTLLLFARVTQQHCTNFKLYATCKGFTETTASLCCSLLEGKNWEKKTTTGPIKLTWVCHKLIFNVST